MSLTSQLKSAISSNDNEKIAKLLDNMDIKAVNRKEDDVTALHVACNNKNQEALELLLARVGIDVNVTVLAGHRYSQPSTTRIFRPSTNCSTGQKLT